MHRAQQRRNPTGRVTEAKATSAAGGQGSGRKRDKTLSEIERINRGREQRRQRISAARDQRARAERRNQQLGREQDVDFQRMVRSWRADREDMAMPHERRDGKELKICVAVRKRPISEREVRRKEFDSISCLNPRVVVHDAKLRVDGITKYLDNQEFAFDHTFHEDDTTEQVYDATARPLIPFVVERQGRATCFAYGQTGSGKTYTMQGIQDFAAEDLFNAVHRSEEPLVVGVSFFEIYGARVQDLLKGRQRLAVREDGKGEVVISGLEEVHTESAQELSDLIETGNRNRTTHATECNDTSSRSHAVCQINVRRAATGKLHGKLSLVDLAGSERAGDTKSNNRQRRLEGAEINKSLLALKECVRALDGGSTHVPYRASKLTMVLKDSFATGSKARTVMIATVSPGNTSSDHSINTLRYADRIKEQNVMSTLHYHHPPASAPPPPSHAADAKAADAKKTPRSKHAAPRADAAAAARSPAPAHGAAAEKDKEAPPSPAARGRGDGAAAEDKARARGAAADRAARKAAAPAAPARQQLAAARQRPARQGIEFSPLKSSTARSEEDDIAYLGETLRKDGADAEGANTVMDLHRTVAGLFEEEEALLNMHMSVIQENAELLTEEGRLLSLIQSTEIADYDIDAYAARLDSILTRKAELIDQLRHKLTRFRTMLKEEEEVSRKAQVHLY